MCRPQVADLQSALDSSNAILNEERESLRKLQAENDAFRAQELADRRRVQHLLALTAPVMQVRSHPSPREMRDGAGMVATDGGLMAGHQHEPPNTSSARSEPIWHLLSIAGRHVLALLADRHRHAQAARARVDMRRPPRPDAWSDDPRRARAPS